mmetsp:Transcript_21512/g.66727  ORF Transcript_21512/g.66727 Transcript_21512/m.66727 type:complete len:207 (-) Transcript_21512:2676-3296(-)
MPAAAVALLGTLLCVCQSVMGIRYQRAVVPRHCVSPTPATHPTGRAQIQRKGSKTHGVDIEWARPVLADTSSSERVGARERRASAPVLYIGALDRRRGDEGGFVEKQTERRERKGDEAAARMEPNVERMLERKRTVAATLPSRNLTQHQLQAANVTQTNKTCLLTPPLRRCHSRTRRQASRVETRGKQRTRHPPRFTRARKKRVAK